MLLFELEIEVGIILQKNEVVVATELENLLASVEGQHGSCKRKLFYDQRNNYLVVKLLLPVGLAPVGLI